MANKSWVREFKEIEKIMLFIETGKYTKSLKDNVEKLNTNYIFETHELHVNALNFRLKKYFRPGKKITTKDFNETITLGNLKKKIKNNFIQQSSDWRVVFREIEIIYVPVSAKDFDDSFYKSFIQINEDYTKPIHKRHVDALNYYLWPFFADGAFIENGIFSENTTIQQLYLILENHYIDSKFGDDDE